MKQLYLLILIPVFAFAQKDPCKITKTSSFAGDNLEFEFTYTYNSNGDLVAEKEFRTVSQGTYTLGRAYEYNEKGYLSKVTNTQNGEFRSAIFKEYNKLGDLVSEIESTDEVLKPLNRVAVLGNNKEKLFYEKDGSVSGREIEVKDSNGNILLKEIRGNENQLYHSYENIYNDQGKLSRSKNVDVVGGLTEERLFQFSSSGQLIQDSTLINGNVNARSLYEYTNGLLTKKTLFGQKNNVEYVINYVNDSEGNLTEESFIYNDELLNRKVYTYSNKLKVKEEQFNKDGVLVKIRTWEYNCN